MATIVADYVTSSTYSPSFDFKMTSTDSYWISHPLYTLLPDSPPIDSLLPDDQYAIVMSAFASVGTIMSVFGLVTNAINVKTFVAMGAEDGVTVSFLFLSSAEFVCFLTTLGQQMSMALWVTEILSRYTIVFPYHPMIFNLFFANIRNCLFTIPVLITLYLSVAKCMCVVKPLHFRNMFSKTRTMWIMSGICVFAVVSYLPILVNIGVAWQFDKNINRTRLVYWSSKDRDVVKNIVWMVRDSCPSVISQVIVVCCIYVMSKALVHAAQFRESSKSGNIESSKNRSGVSHHDLRTRLSTTELQVMKQVVVISVIYIVGNTPKVAIFVGLYIVPDLAVGKRYQNVYAILMNSRELVENWVSAVNIIIYYCWNSKFRRYCKL